MAIYDIWGGGKRSWWWYRRVKHPLLSFASTRQGQKLLTQGKHEQELSYGWGKGYGIWGEMCLSKGQQRVYVGQGKCNDYRAACMGHFKRQAEPVANVLPVVVVVVVVVVGIGVVVVSTSPLYIYELKCLVPKNRYS